MFSGGSKRGIQVISVSPIPDLRSTMDRSGWRKEREKDRDRRKSGPASEGTVPNPCLHASANCFLLAYLQFLLISTSLCVICAGTTHGLLFLTVLKKGRQIPAGQIHVPAMERNFSLPGNECL